MMNDEIKTVKRGKTAGYSSVKLKAKRTRKFEEACDRNADHNALTVEEKIAKARSRRGGSKREIARLTTLLTVKESVAEKPKAAKKKTVKKAAKKS